MAMFMETKRTGYAPDQCRKTMTVGELVNFLIDYYGADIDDEYGTVEFYNDVPIYFSNDDGYTYGEITEDCFREDY